MVAASLPESQSLEGVSLQAKTAATLPVLLDGQLSPGMPPAAAPPVPSRPSQPCATEVPHDSCLATRSYPRDTMSLSGIPGLTYACARVLTICFHPGCRHAESRHVPTLFGPPSL